MNGNDFDMINGCELVLAIKKNWLLSGVTINLTPNTIQDLDQSSGCRIKFQSNQTQLIFFY